MSRPGYWKSAGSEPILIRDMTDAHLHNSLRYMALRYDIIAAMPETSYSEREDKRNKADWNERKLAELAEDAQRRSMLPANDLSVTEVVRLAKDWPVQREPQTVIAIQPAPAAPRPWHRPGAVVNLRALVDAHNKNEAVNQIAKAPPRRLGIYLNVIREIEEIIMLPVHGMDNEQEVITRLIQMD